MVTILLILIEILPTDRKLRHRQSSPLLLTLAPKLTNPLVMVPQKEHEQPNSKLV